MSAQVILAIAGNIGSGKTTLTERLTERLGFVGLFESTEANPYLSDFYLDMQRWALPAQLRFLVTRVRDIKATLARGISAVQDRTSWEDAEIFAANLHARGAIDDRDFGTYQAVAELVLSGLPAPDLLVYLRRPVESCRSNIARRGRAYEESIETSYLADLERRYDDWFSGWTRGPKLQVEAQAYDFLESDADLETLVSTIETFLPQQQLVFP